jgi:hypothetical protein
VICQIENEQNVIGLVYFQLQQSFSSVAILYWFRKKGDAFCVIDSGSIVWIKSICLLLRHQVLEGTNLAFEYNCKCWKSLLGAEAALGRIHTAAHTKVTTQVLFCFLSLWLYISLDLGRFFGFLILCKPVGLLGRGISPSQGCYLHRHSCLELDSNPRSNCPSGRRRFTVIGDTSLVTFLKSLLTFP